MTRAREAVSSMGNTYHVAAERLVQAVRPSVTIARQKIRDAPNQTRGALGPITPRLLTPLGHGYCSGHELRDWLCCGWSPASAWSRHTRADSDGGWARVWLRSWVSALSSVGIGLSTITLLAMPPLAQAKRRVGSALGSPATISESRQTMLCAYLFRGAVDRFAGERDRGLVVGGSPRRAHDRRGRCARGARGLEGRELRLLLGRRCEATA